MSHDKSNARRQAELQAATLASAERRKSKGFARGTLIHTPGGPVPIELLRPGYMVLSRAPDPFVWFTPVLESWVAGVERRPLRYRPLQRTARLSVLPPRIYRR